MELTASILFLAVALCAFADAMFERKTLRLDRFLGVCPRYKNATIQLYDIHIRSGKKDFSMSSRIRVLKDTSSNLKMKMVFEKCKSKEALDSCEAATDVNFSEACTIINMNLPPASAYLDKVRPKARCPVKKGLYELVNGTSDQTALSMFPVLGWYWRGYTYILDKIEGEYKIIFCCYIEGTVAVVT